MRAVIFDIDGTLADVTHRLHHLEGERKDWDSFFAAQEQDGPIQAVVDLARILQHGVDHIPYREEFQYQILVVSARPDDHREVTQAWLTKHLIFPQKLYMRKSGDFRPDQIVKAEILEEILNDGYDPFLVIDDRPQVVEMWRSFGITCLQCAPDEPVNSKHQGQILLHMLVGPSGSGKSTYAAAKYEAKDVVSSDEIRRQLFGDHEKGHTAEELAQTWKYIHGLIKLRMDNGLFTVLDATNLKQKDRMAVLKNVPKGILVQYVVIDRDYDEKMANRGWRPEALIHKHHTQMRANIKDVLNADGQGHIIIVDKR